jgi:hypothetical protein
MIHYIGIHGPKRVGKDEFAKNLSRFINTSERDKGDRIYIDRLAHPLYVWCSEITGWSHTDLMGSKKDTPLNGSAIRNGSLIGRTPRSLLLDLGIFVRQTYGQNFLNNCLIQRAESVRFSDDLWVFVPDVRTEAEAAHMDLTFDLSRDGCSYEGGITEHAFEGLKSVVPIHLKTCDDTSLACDFRSIYTNHLLSRKVNYANR